MRKDQTGNTRYLPIAVHDIDIDGFCAIRDQLFAEALRYYRKRPKDWWKLSPEGEAIARELREERRQRAAYEENLPEWLIRTRCEKTWVEDLMSNYLMLPKERWVDRRIHMELTDTLKAIGWEKLGRKRLPEEEKQKVVWVPSEEWRAKHLSNPPQGPQEAAKPLPQRRRLKYMERIG